jgi:NAD(P)H dehydrogenase (quinone)
MPIAITGATGHLGRLVIDDLLSAGVPGTDLIAIARDPDKALALTNAGVQVRVADYNDRDSMQAALVGVDKMLLISSPQIGSRVPQHRNIIDAATTAGVSHVAYTSVLHADISHIGLAAEHYVTENAIASSGLDFTFLRNGWYWENFTTNVRGIGLASALQTGTLLGAGGDGRLAGAARADYAQAAATVLVTPGHIGRFYELGGERLTYAELAAIVSETTGTTVVYKNLTEDQYRSALVKAGLTDTAAKTVASYDSGIARGELDTQTGDLQTLIGRPLTPITEIIKEAHQRALTAR